MKAESFISRRLGFGGRLATVAVAVSFFVIIIALAVSGGFRKEIRGALSDLTGDVQLFGQQDTIDAVPSYMDKLLSVEGVESIRPVVCANGIVKGAEDIQGVVFKGVGGMEGEPLQVSIPSRLATSLGLSSGDRMLTYFIGEKVKVRKFTIASIYESLVDTDESLVVYASIDDIRRVLGLAEDTAGCLEVRFSDNPDEKEMLDRAAELGTVSLLNARDDEPVLLSVAAPEKYRRLFDWLSLIDFNVIAILILMTIVAGFNMISGSLIMLFRNTSAIGTLKALGMTDRAIAGVFVRVSSRTVLKGMLWGNAAALILCLVQGCTHFLKLDPASYFVSFVPVDVDFLQVLAVDAISYAAIVLMLLLPCLFISGVDPAKTVKVR